jgi:hypothetical protein
LQIPASSEVIEWFFSNWRYIDSSIPNRVDAPIVFFLFKPVQQNNVFLGCDKLYNNKSYSHWLPDRECTNCGDCTISGYSRENIAKNVAMVVSNFFNN